MVDPCERCPQPDDSPVCEHCFYNPDVIDSMVHWVSVPDADAYEHRLVYCGD